MKCLVVLWALFSIPLFGWVQDSEPYRLHELDVIIITVLGEPDLGQRVQVGRDGTINLMLAGNVKVVGLTPQEAARLIARRYEEGGYLKDPKVNVSVDIFHRPRVFVLGMVSRPGAFEFKYGDRVLDALSYAGGYLPNRADLNKSRIIRRDGTELPLDLVKLLEEADMSLNYELKDEDVIYIPEELTNRIFVGGWVARPGQYAWQRRMTLLDALTAAGWNLDRGTLSRVYIVRSRPDGHTERLTVNVLDILQKADLSKNIPIQAGDVIYVPETRTPRWREAYDILSLYWLAKNVGLLRTLWRP